jgi:hypothetical protein
MTAARRGGVPLSALRRVTRTRPVPADGERCEMCAKPITKAHSHVVDLHSRSLMCACRPCYLLFTDMHATLHYRSVPERYLALDRTAVDGRTWDELQIPVGLAFLFRNSVQQRMVAFYPGPAGATESELPLAAWDRIVAQSPQLALLRPDVEALLVRRPGEDCFVVPIDACYELVGQLRRLWRGFDGGSEAHALIDTFFAGIRQRSRPSPPVGRT